MADENGLVQRAQEPTQEAAPAEDGESNLTPEEQESYDSAMQMVSEIIYNNEESNQAIMGMISAEDPAGTIAEATIFVMSQIEEAFQGNYPEELIIVTSDEVSDLLIELADESGTVKMTEEIATNVKSQLIEQLAEEYGADPEDLQMALGDITQTDVDEMQATMGGPNA